MIAAGVALAAAALAIVLAVVLGGEQTDADRLASLQEDVQPALAALELIPIHYESTNATTHAAAAEQLGVARETIDGVAEDLRERDAVATERLLEGFEQLDGLVRTTGRTSAVQRATRDAAADLRALVGLGPARG